MVTVKPLSRELSVCSFVSPHDLPEMAKEFRTIVNARPDAEETGQLSSAQIAKAAKTQGVNYVHIPVVPGQISDAQVADFTEVLDNQPGPVLAFCRTGARAASLWALATAKARGVDQVIDAAAKAGFDLQGLYPRLRDRAKA